MELAAQGLRDKGGLQSDLSDHRQHRERLILEARPGREWLDEMLVAKRVVDGEGTTREPHLHLETYTAMVETLSGLTWACSATRERTSWLRKGRS